MLLPSLVQVSESISGSVVPLAMFIIFSQKTINNRTCGEITLQALHTAYQETCGDCPDTIAKDREEADIIGDFFAISWQFFVDFLAKCFGLLSQMFWISQLIS